MTTNLISKLLYLYTGGDNDKTLTGNKYFSKRDLLEIKCSIDQWGNITNYFIMNTCHKKTMTNISECLCEDDCDCINYGNSIWGAHILFLDECPTDKIFAATDMTDEEHPSRNVAILNLV